MLIDSVTVIVMRMQDFQKLKCYLEKKANNNGSK